MISQHPEVEAKVLKELEELQLLASPECPAPRQLEYTDLSKLTYLTCCIKESMRLYPVVPMIFRKAMRKQRIGRYTIPKGTFFIIHIMATHTSDRNWERAAEFLPERWLDPDCEYARPVDPTSRYVPTGPADLFAAEKPVNGHINGSHNGHAAREPHKQARRVKRWFPYGEGNRQCIGMPLASINLQASVASLLAAFKFKLADEMGGAEGVSKAETYTITLSPGNGLMMHCIPRAKVTNT
ncbi:probable 1,25-dihydroxyvitamin D(3) 24-hydroxylase, mitochondrial [Coccomyxa sp. Obi]|nr:probable 1,25-dihydroxyvitamin D(3) 24-hydroxylase, mitochondrial [Coccomyxa sp. Obi]